MQRISAQRGARQTHAAPPSLLDHPEDPGLNLQGLPRSHALDSRPWGAHSPAVSRPLAGGPRLQGSQKSTNPRRGRLERGISFQTCRSTFSLSCGRSLCSLGVAKGAACPRGVQAAGPVGRTGMPLRGPSAYSALGSPAHSQPASQRGHMQVTAHKSAWDPANRVVPSILQDEVPRVATFLALHRQCWHCKLQHRHVRPVGLSLRACLMARNTLGLCIDPGANRHGFRMSAGWVSRSSWWTAWMVCN